METKNKPQHTQGEWKHEQDAANSIRIFCDDNTLTVIAEIIGEDEPTEEQMANAKRIVMAVNMHDSLMGQLRRMLKLAEDACKFHGNNPDADKDILGCRKVVKQVEQHQH